MTEKQEQQLAAAMGEFLDREAGGETVDIAGFCGNYPDLEADLRPQLETLRQIEKMSSPGPEFRPPESRDELPERLSGHKILSEIGTGGMGRVILAVDERLGRKVAIKTLSRRFRDNVTIRARFMQEARALARLSHPNVVRIYELGPPEEPPHFVMEYLEGTSLTEAAGALPLRQKVELMHKVVRAAGFLHEHQQIHRDLKPGNILVGADLEPKLLDFGLALQLDNQAERLTLAGDILGTPRYFSPEQTRATTRLDARSDVFSLGTVLYEVLTGALPFRAETYPEQVRSICEEDPILPRRLNRNVSGEIQNICLQALEKNPADRYGSAREMADDLARFLAGEPVLAAPASYGRLMGSKIEQHLRELEAWREDQILDESEYAGLRQRYDRLIEREDAWILEARRLSLPQVSLYLGGWILVVAAALLFLFRHPALAGAPLVLAVSAAAAPAAWLGIRCWKQGGLRIGVAYLLAFCLLLPAALLVTMGEYGIAATVAPAREKWEFLAPFSSFKMTTNAQLWWALLLSLPVYYWLRRFTRAAVFSLVFAVMTALLCLATLLRMGMLEWLDEDPGKLYLRLVPVALLFLATGMSVERLRLAADSRYFYPLAVVFTWVALSGVAATHKPYREWLESLAPWTRGSIEYLFIINAGIYLVLQHACDRLASARMEQLRGVAKAFRFVIPGHVMTSLLLLGLEATNLWNKTPHSRALRLEARTFEILLPALACLFVFASIPKQMKNYFLSGLFFLAIGIVRLQQNLFENQGKWPLTLLIAGLALMIGAANYAALKITLWRWIRRRG